jgi:hypothetical protein
MAKLSKRVEKRREHAVASCRHLVMVVVLLLFGGTSTIGGLAMVAQQRVVVARGEMVNEMRERDVT